MSVTDLSGASSAMATIYTEHVENLVVERRQDIAAGIVGLELAAADGRDLPAWTPGAHIDLLLDDGVTRQYSLCGDPAERSRWRIAVLLNGAGRGGSKLVHERLLPGSSVRTRGPRNHFLLVAADEYLFLAGGIGITPLLPMIRWASAAGSRWRLHYGGRSRASMAFLDELAGYGDRVDLWPEDERGMLDLATVLAEPVPGAAIYACGPEAMLAAVEEHSDVWPAGSLHLERFSARPVDLESVTAAASIEVVLQRSGITVTVPEDKTILEVVEEAGVSVLSSCREGVCGTCETRVIEGVPDHRDSLLTEEEQAEGDYMMICISRAKTGRLVLDL